MPKLPSDRAARLRRYEALALEVIVNGKSPYAAGRSILGFRSKSSIHDVLKSPLYEEARQNVLAQVEKPQEGLRDEICGIVLDTAYHGAIEQNRIVKESDNERLVNTIADSALDRVGVRAPQRVEQSISLVLGPDTIRMIEKLVGDLEQMKGVDYDNDPEMKRLTEKPPGSAGYVGSPFVEKPDLCPEPEEDGAGAAHDEHAEAAGFATCKICRQQRPVHVMPLHLDNCRRAFNGA